MKSTEYVRKRIESGLANVPLQDDAKFTEVRFDEYIKTHVKEEFQKRFKNNKYQAKYENVKITVEEKELIGDIIANISYNENADFEYFTMEQCICDGTLLFIDELLQKVFLKVMYIQTVNSEKIPDDFNKNPFDYELSYTVGNFVICDEYGDFGAKEKPWLHSRFTVMLPIKLDIIKCV